LDYINLYINTQYNKRIETKKKHTKKKKMIINLEIFKFLLISITLFLISLFGIFLLKRNLIVILMSIELSLLSINFNFILFSIYLDDIIGQIFTLLILTVAAAESSIGLAILVMYYRRKGLISINVLSYIKG
jgi:NADH-quinone oxidoreductase subunit K